MKTNRIFQQKTLRLMSLFVGAITVVSCGSYQNSSYYDDDGVYGPDNSVKTKRVVQNETTSGSYSNAYAQQFKSMKEDFGPTEVLTDVDNYKSAPDTVYVKENGTRYGGWGENQTNNNILIVNDNWGWNNWGMNGWGWNGWYGNNWGMNGWYGNNWGMNGWGWNGWYGNNWGMNGWGWYGNNWGMNGWYGNGWYGNNWGMNGWYGNGWYGGGRNVVINNGPRGGYINNNGNSGRLTSGRVGNSTGSPRTQIGQTRGTTIGTPRTQVSDPRTFNPRGNTNTETPRAPISDPRTYTPRGNTNTGTPRTQTSEPRTYTPRNDTPRTISTPRSSDFGGGRSSGGFGGGGRSGGGGRGGR